MTWMYLFPGFADLSPPRTLCEDSIADNLVELWRKDATEKHRVEFHEPDRTPTTDGHLDLGGMASSRRKIYVLEPIDGLTIHVPAKDVSDYLYILSQSDQKEPEWVAGKGFYTLPSFRVGVFLSLPQCEALRKRLSKIVVEAEAFATAENDAFNKFMAKRKAVVAPLRPTGKIEEA